MPIATTSLKLPDAVRVQAAAAARRQGTTPHAFMVDAIRSAADAATRRAQFVEQALAAQRTLHKSGKGYLAQDVHAFLRARAGGQPTRKPRLKTWRG